MIKYLDKEPILGTQVFIAEGAKLVGDVTIGDRSNIWFNSVIRGDVAYVRIGQETNIQDSTTIHVTRNGHPTIIGSRVTVGHQCMLHACRLEDLCFIGMGSIILDDAIVESYGMLAAGSMLTGGKIIPSYELWAGRPAKFFRKLTKEEIVHIDKSADNYVRLAAEYVR